MTRPKVPIDRRLNSPVPQDAKLWEIRAATLLGRLWRRLREASNQGRSGPAHSGALEWMAFGGPNTCCPPSWNPCGRAAFILWCSASFKDRTLRTGGAWPTYRILTSRPVTSPQPGSTGADAECRSGFEIDKKLKLVRLQHRQVTRD
jgi:hypothetical protein